jgi:CRISPR/Cas system CSM-associated protein Csm3 (group 7 of RAMP superfamily)
MSLDDFGARALTARWTIQGVLTLRSAAHFGGAQGDDDADMMVLRDRLTGQPFLPGTSLAGALRSHLADRLAGYATEEPAIVELLFGGKPQDDPAIVGPQSAAIVFDSFVRPGAQRHSEIRDGVAIDGPSGIASDHFKYDIEVLPAGAQFDIRVDLLVPREKNDVDWSDSFATPPDDFEQGLVALLTTAISGLESEISLGAKRSRGFGQLSIGDWSIHRFDLQTREGWLGWLASDHEKPASGGAVAWPPAPMDRVVDRRKRVTVTANLEVEGAIQIASPSADPEGTDVAHLRSGNQSIVAGTSLAGALRNRALRIANVVRENDGALWVDALFGPRGPKNLKASRLRVSESVIDGGRRLRPTRIRIDRFTQGVVDGALFDEEPQFGGSVTVKLELRDPGDGEAGLVLLLLKDLLTGDLPIGGTSSVGRGVLKGFAQIEMPEGQDGVSVRVSSALDPSGNADAIVAQRLNHEVRRFHDAGPAKEVAS